MAPFGMNQDMTILMEKEYFYSSCKGADSTNYLTKQQEQRNRCLLSAQKELQGHPSRTYGGRTGCLPWLREKPKGGFQSSVPCPTEAAALSELGSGIEPADSPVR